MWAIWVLIAGAALASFYALSPDAHLSGPPPDMPAALAGDMATYRSQLEDYVINHHSANGVVPQTAFVHSGNWNYTSLRWQNYVNSGIVVVYPSTTGVTPLPAGFLGAMLKQARNSIEAGAAQNGQIVNPANTSGNVSLPASMPPLPDGTPVWIAQVF